MNDNGVTVEGKHTEYTEYTSHLLAHVRFSSALDNFFTGRKTVDDDALQLLGDDQSFYLSP